MKLRLYLFLYAIHLLERKASRVTFFQLVLIFIKKGFHQATFLPQVWDSIPDKGAFLTHLCMKADLDGDEWERDLEVYVYEVDCFSSKQTS